MKSKSKNLSMWLIITYIVMVIVCLVLNTQTNQSSASVLINIAMFVIVGIIFFNATKTFGQLRKMTTDLDNASNRILTDFNVKKVYLWGYYAENNVVILTEPEFRQAYEAYANEMKRLELTSEGQYKCTIEEYINRDLIDNTLRKSLYSLVPGTMTGLGILGTFIGLSFGLKEFNTGSSSEISDSIAPLMDGIKVAFHTSIYGMVFSLIFNFVFKRAFEEAYQSLNKFLNLYSYYVLSDAQRDNDSNIQRMLGKMPEEIADKMAGLLTPPLMALNTTLKEYTANISEIQAESMSNIVNRFVEEMNKSLGDSFLQLGKILDQTCEQQNQQNDLITGLIGDLSRSYTSIHDINEETQKTIENLAQYMSQLEELQGAINKDVMSVNIQMEAQAKLNTEMEDCFEKLVTKETELITTVSQTITNMEQSAAGIEKAQDVLNENSKQALELIFTKSQEFENEIAEAAKKQIEQITDLANATSSDMTKASQELAKISGTLNKDLTDSLDRTFDSFDSNLAEISQRLSGTISGLNKTLEEIDSTTERVPQVISQAYEAMQTSLYGVENSLNNMTETLVEKLGSQTEDNQ